jgi:hypothetical protein
MRTTDCGIVVERLDAQNYRATAANFPDCQAVAPTAEAARQAVEEAIARILRERQHCSALPERESA